MNHLVVTLEIDMTQAPSTVKATVAKVCLYLDKNNRDRESKGLDQVGNR